MGRSPTDGRGLEGVIATSTAISSIIGSTLTYRGIDIGELLAHSTFEEVVYLLWYGELPTVSQLDSFHRELARHRSLPDSVLTQIRDSAPSADPMATVRTAISVLAANDPRADDRSPQSTRETCMRLLAAFPSVVAARARLYGGQEPLIPDPGLDEASNFLYTLNGHRPASLQARIMNQVLILLADHELNASTFAARVAASTLADLYSAVIAGICTLSGPLHGRASEGVQRMLLDVASPDEVQSWVQRALDRRERIMGFGHRVYKAGDPRAKWLRRMSQELAEATGEPRWYDLSVRFESEVRAATGLLPNVDFYLVSVYGYLGIPVQLFTPVFAISRVAGWIAHILEQYSDNRLIRPRAEYIGPLHRHYTPIEER